MGQTLVEEQVAALKKLWANKRQLAFQGLNLAMIVFSALMIWKSLMVVTKSESPVVVVLSGSMEPAFQRGDILFLNNQVRPCSRRPRGTLRMPRGTPGICDGSSLLEPSRRQ